MLNQDQTSKGSAAKGLPRLCRGPSRCKEVQKLWGQSPFSGASPPSPKSGRGAAEFPLLGRGIQRQGSDERQGDRGAASCVLLTEPGLCHSQPAWVCQRGTGLLGRCGAVLREWKGPGGINSFPEYCWELLDSSCFQGWWIHPCHGACWLQCPLGLLSGFKMSWSTFIESHGQGVMPENFWKLFSFERKSSSPQIAPTICWSCRLGVDASWSQLIHCFCPSGAECGPETTLDPLLTQLKVPAFIVQSKQPLRPHILFVQQEFNIQHKQTQSTSAHLLICTILKHLKCILYTGWGKAKRKQSKKMYCLRRKREQIRTRKMLLPLWWTARGMFSYSEK